MKCFNKLSFIIIIILVFLIVSLSASAVCPPKCSQAELIQLVQTDPKAAYNVDQFQTVIYTGGTVLDDPALAKDFFRKNPGQMMVYRSQAQKYLLRKGKIDSKLMQIYLQQGVYIDNNDFNIARRYLKLSKFDTSADKKIFQTYLTKLKSLSATDRSIAKRYFTKSNGKLINENAETRKLFSKYLKSEGVDSYGILGPVKSFSNDGVLNGKNGAININDYIGKNREYYAIKVVEDGSIRVVSKQKQTKTIPVYDAVASAQQLKEAGEISKRVEGYKFMMKYLGMNPSDYEYIGEMEGKIALKIVPVIKETETETVRSVGLDFTGDLKLDQETGKFKMSKGTLRAVKVKGGSDITFGSKAFTGKFEEVQGIEFASPTHVTVDDYYKVGSEEKIVNGRKTNSRARPEIRILQSEDGTPATVKRIKYEPYGDYTYIDSDGSEVDYVSEKIDKGVLEVKGAFNLNKYSQADTKVKLVVPRSKDDPMDNALTINDVTVLPHDKSGTKIFFPEQKVGYDEQSNLFVKFTKDGIMSAGQEVRVKINPAALVKNEIANGKWGTEMMILPSRGYFTDGDYPKQGTGAYDSLIRVQRAVGADETGVYDKQTIAKVKEWQSKTILDGRKIKVDGRFGRQSLLAYLQNTQGTIDLKTQKTFYHSSVKAKDGKIQITGFGNVDVTAGRKVYAFKSETELDEEEGAEKLSESLDNDKLDEGDEDEPTVTKAEFAGFGLYKVPGLNPSQAAKDVTVPLEFEAGNVLLPQKHFQAIIDRTNPRFMPYYRFNRQTAYEQSGNFIDSLVNPELVAEGVEIRQEYMDMIQDGKLRVLYVAGKRDEASATIYHDANILIPEGPEELSSPSTKRFTKQYPIKGSDGKQLDVEVVVAYSQAQAEQELAKGGVDVFTISSHSTSYGQFSLYHRTRGGINPNVFSNYVDSNPTLSLVSTSACLSKGRIYPKLKSALGPQTDFLLTQTRVGKDATSTVLAGILTGQSKQDIARIANAEEKAASYVVIKGS
ncbi:MAG: hypothetical protein ABIG89_07270 [Candidatus Woesearchaeota archaeon]